jgi:hypothetical protein
MSIQTEPLMSSFLLLVVALSTAFLVLRMFRRVNARRQILLRLARFRADLEDPSEVGLPVRRVAA